MWITISIPVPERARVPNPSQAWYRGWSLQKRLYKRLFEQVFIHIAFSPLELFHWDKFQGVNYSKDKENQLHCTVLDKCCHTVFQSQVSDFTILFKENSHLLWARHHAFKCVFSFIILKPPFIDFRVIKRLAGEMAARSQKSKLFLSRPGLFNPSPTPDLIWKMRIMVSSWHKWWELRLVRLLPWFSKVEEGVLGVVRFSIAGHLIHTKRSLVFSSV